MLFIGLRQKIDIFSCIGERGKWRLICFHILRRSIWRTSCPLVPICYIKYIKKYGMQEYAILKYQNLHRVHHNNNAHPQIKMHPLGGSSL